MNIKEFTDEDYFRWLEQMTPYLMAGNSLNYSLLQCGLSQHKDLIYDKYNANDWFCRKVSELQSMPGEKVNKVFYAVICKIEQDMANGLPLSDQQVRLLISYAEHHRSAQPFFVNRSEVAQVRPIAEVMAALDTNPDDSRKRMAEEFKKQSLEANTPVQDQGQNGSDSDVPAKSDPTSTSH